MSSQILAICPSNEEYLSISKLKSFSRDLIKAFNQYFNIFPKNFLNKDKEGFDMGCGSGRWAKIIAPQIKKLNCIDPSNEALNVAKKNLLQKKNVIFYNKGVNEKAWRLKNLTLENLP